VGCAQDRDCASQDAAAVRRVVRIRSRYEAENNSWYAGILRTAVNHIVGNGPRLQLLTESPEANARIEKAWRQWATKIDLAAMLRTICEAYWRDGEVFAMRADRPQNWPLTLDIRTIEARLPAANSVRPPTSIMTSSTVISLR
jgi:capsid protein